MPAADPLVEFRTRWLPHITDAGLVRLSRLLESASPMLIRGTFSRAVPMGCLASHIAWNHPITADLDEDAGIRWLAKVAKLNPATSAVIVAWDRDGVHDRELCEGLVAECRVEQRRREAAAVGAAW